MPIDGQEKQRRLEEFADKHGRLYEANIEIKTGDPCEALRPKFTAPTGPDWFRNQLTPPCDDLEIVRMVPRLYRARKGYQIEVDYTRWLQKWDDAEDALLRKMQAFANGMAGGHGNVIEMMRNPPPELLKEIGRGPRRIPRAFIEAAAAGNKWALGLSDVIPAKAEALLRELEPIALAKQRRNTIGFDPLADDDAPVESEQEEGASFIDPLDALLDLEEQHDPKAVGGTKVPPTRRRGKREPVET